jgi:hypothetical protein
LKSRANFDIFTAFFDNKRASDVNIVDGLHMRLNKRNNFVSVNFTVFSDSGLTL